MKVKEHIIFLDKTSNYTPWAVKHSKDPSNRKSKYFNSFEDAFEYVRKIYYPENNVKKRINPIYYVFLGIILGSSLVFYLKNIF